jgi:TRAP-type C4-dicarboxylate transport system substrate-binding protein
MKKRIVSLILSIIMIASLSACNGGGGSTTAATTSSQAAASTATNTESENTAIEPLTIKFNVTFQENETGGVVLNHFINKLSELSNDAVKVDVAWGGTLFTANDELDAIIDGSVNMVVLGHMRHVNTLPYLAFPAFAPGGNQAVLDYFDTLLFSDPETSAIIQGEAEAMGIRYLNVIAGGSNAFCSKFEFKDLDSLISGSTSFGNMDAVVFEDLGFQVTSLFPPDIYDALTRGLIDSTQMALSPMVAMSWFEPAPYWALDGTYTAGNFYTVNVKWWNGLSDAQREVIQQAATDTQIYTSTIYDEAVAKDVAFIEEKTGKKFVQFSQSDVERIWASIFEAKAAAALELAKPSGKTEGMIKILEKAAEITNYDWKHE